MLTIDQTPSVAEVLSDIHDESVQNQDEQRDIFVEEKGKEKEKENDGALESSDIPTLPETPPETPPDVTNVDWTKYEPPEGLMHVGGVQSALVMQVVQESIDRIKARILEAEQERLLAEEEKQKQEEAASQENEEMRQSGSLDDQLRNDSVQVEAPQPPNVEDAPRTESRDGFPSELPKRPRKRGLMGLFRKLNTGAEHGESSAAGAARHRLLASSSSAELTYSARKRFVLDLIRKSTGEDTSTTPTEGNEVECVSCLDDFNPKDTVRAPCHNYCVPCFRRLIASACQNEQHWPPKCCLNNIPDSTIITNVDEQQRMEYRERALEWNLPIADRIYCSQSECSQFIRPEYIIPGRDVARCTDGHYTCTICRNPQHDGADCPQDHDLARTNELAEEEGWKRCYGCKAYVEHREACQHITCRCGAEFCYVCGARWRTCACTMTQLAILKQFAAARREKRLAKEAEEEAWIREAVRLVEEYKREQDLKAELLRQEQVRKAEERRRIELEARIYREGERRRAIMLKFSEARTAVAALHPMQRDAVRERHERSAAQSRQRHETALRRLLEMHALERELQRAKADARIAKREGRFRAEYVARVAEERAIEEQYADKLRAFWGGRAGGAAKTQAALDDLRRRMDGGCAAWRRWMDGELDAYRHHVREEQAIGEELMDDKERRVRGRARDAAVALARRRNAELRWVEEVVAERERLLQELENEEVENGEDIDTWFAEGPLEEALAANPWT